MIIVLQDLDGDQVFVIRKPGVGNVLGLGSVAPVAQYRGWDQGLVELGQLQGAQGPGAQYLDVVAHSLGQHLKKWNIY